MREGIGEVFFEVCTGFEGAAMCLFVPLFFGGGREGEGEVVGVWGV